MHLTPIRSITGRGRAAATLAWRAAAGLCLLTILAAAAQAQRAAVPRLSLADLSIEELMEISITTVSKNLENLIGAPAAVFAISNDDLRRSGAPSLPEALRLAPGLQVSRIGAHDWAISGRGFTYIFANKLLVLRDGRSLYTPLFSGVWWDAQDTLLEDVERIEIVRGPGATLWGANAVNGVISIITKPAQETQGLLATAAAGSDPEARGTVRYGGAIDANTHYRVYAKHPRFAPSELATGGEARDAGRLGLAGFRVDREAPGGPVLTLQGDAYSGREHQDFLIPLRTPPFVGTASGDIRISGGNLLARLTRRVGGGELMAQTYFDYTSRDQILFKEVRRTYDLEVQHRMTVASAHELTFGAGFRTSTDSLRNSDTLTHTPANRRLNLWNAFVQDDIALVPQRWHLVLGAKQEHNDFTGAEFQPGARLRWTPNGRNTAWAPSLAPSARPRVRKAMLRCGQSPGCLACRLRPAATPPSSPRCSSPMRPDIGFA